MPCVRNKLRVVNCIHLHRTVAYNRTHRCGPEDPGEEIPKAGEEPTYSPKSWTTGDRGPMVHSSTRWDGGGKLSYAGSDDPVEHRNDDAAAKISRYELNRTCHQHSQLVEHARRTPIVDRDGLHITSCQLHLVESAWILGLLTILPPRAGHALPVTTPTEQILRRLKFRSRRGFWSIGSKLDDSCVCSVATCCCLSTSIMKKAGEELDRKGGRIRVGLEG
jgi:hypothetical protein